MFKIICFSVSITPLYVLLGVDDGISIPYSYTSHLSPLQSPKLYNEIRNCREKDKHFLAHFETPYVVYLHNKKELAPSQPLFTFSHPNKGDSMKDVQGGLFIGKFNESELITYWCCRSKVSRQ